MRIVIDMQGAQSASRFRGIGRYTLGLVQHIVRNRGKHEIFLALNGLLPESIESIRAVFRGMLPSENIRVWYAPGPTAEFGGNDAAREVAELVREAFLASLKPDLIHITSMFEGYVDNAVTSIGRFDRQTPVSICLYDLIPLLNPDEYLKPHPRYEEYYQRKVKYAEHARCLLAISESSQREGQQYLSVPEEHVYNISSAIEQSFEPRDIAPNVAADLRKKFGIKREFVLYTGGADERKNLSRLIQAFGKLPAALRGKHQLLFAGHMTQDRVDELHRDAESHGLVPDELMFTGYVSDDELIQLYNLCKVFVFPSWHEGFGLPPLEAMACGAAVIGANTSSLPEVIGLDDAMFDPLDVDAIAAKLALTLEDDAFRAKLRAHGLQRAQLFSWDKTARRAIAAWEEIVQHPAPAPVPRIIGRKPRLAFVSPLPPERTGIADYSAELLPALAEYYDIELVVAQDHVELPWAHERAVVRDAGWLREHAGDVDRVLYQMGNSPFHQHMLTLMREVPGTVVLHDFYLSSLLAWLEIHAGAGPVWTQALYEGHGYRAVRDRFRDLDEARRHYPVSLSVLRAAHGVIFHSHYSRELARKWYGACVAGSTEVVPLLRQPAKQADRDAARAELGLAKDTFLICSFGFLDTTKQNERLLRSWLASALASDRRCLLVFVGENHGGQYGTDLVKTIQRSAAKDRVKITGFASPEIFQRYLAAADLAVQLRMHSRGETSAAALDCMNYGLPLITNANGALAELDRDAVWMLDDDFDDAELTQALEALWRDEGTRSELGTRARRIIAEHHAPPTCARQYADAIERFYSTSRIGVPGLIDAIVQLPHFNPDETGLCKISGAIAASLPEARPGRRLFLDVTATCRNDLKTGIERVVRALVLALFEAPPEGWRIEPIFLSDNGGRWHYRSASAFVLEMLGCPKDVLPEQVVSPENGDIILGLDLAGDLLVRAAEQGLYEEYRNRGVGIYFLVHDILPVRMPEVFPPGAHESFERWLNVIARFDGAVCVSKAVADDLTLWRVERGLDMNERPFKVAVSHHGADVQSSAPSSGKPDNARQTLDALSARPSFLMVGTLEPRKGYLQVLDAFEHLWNSGRDVNLVIVGREGWKGLPDDMRRDIPETVNRLANHSQKGNRLFWLADVSDEYLNEIYASCICLISASYGEGFGLPLIEAATHSTPLLLRDIPVFREVAGEHAAYFRSSTGEELAAAVEAWLALYERGQVPQSDKISFLTWQQSAGNLSKFIHSQISSLVTL
ncbi:glycosyltransferase [Burkholderia multivorans]|uniref:glycosyltransferase n=1 Tax=Burkholderia multivorans TaxID=87883 RepID=UPI001C222819|nr:glycosyltransferase [Burkholderia multivorans]MBU9262811.1 glycosyltransferase [Burkholderia multivorans]